MFYIFGDLDGDILIMVRVQGRASQISIVWYICMVNRIQNLELLLLSYIIVSESIHGL